MLTGIALFVLIVAGAIWLIAHFWNPATPAWYVTRRNGILTWAGRVFFGALALFVLFVLLSVLFVWGGWNWLTSQMPVAPAAAPVVETAPQAVAPAADAQESALAAAQAVGKGHCALVNKDGAFLTVEEEINGGWICTYGGIPAPAAPAAPQAADGSGAPTQEWYESVIDATKGDRSPFALLTILDNRFNESGYQFGSPWGPEGTKVPNGAYFWTDFGDQWVLPNGIVRIHTQGNWGVYRNTSGQDFQITSGQTGGGRWMSSTDAK